ncbi:hypothetical protein KRR38_27595 [Novosphingobium sp. G106]|uniref:hypothetical protein n=1 Tax=Novosphingobium sp. G106 TaxID=2849500 RepID=UPI001C2DDA86|nr:hypothetical protein [Novosphingobium sp. G106]MBV1691347.1 hypothetical protein [Novosphingobium sp. G106]
MNFFKPALVAVAVVLLPSVASAQATPPTMPVPNLSAGVVVYDPQGAEVGRIVSAAGDSVVLDTGTNKATLPKNVFGVSAKGPTVNATRGQIDAMVAAASAKANAALEAALVPGAEVKGSAGALIGTIKDVSGDNVTIDRAAGPVRIARKAFTVGPHGLTISLTTAELEAAAQAATQPPSGGAS